eukprot:TRINITY_DN9175_c0_g1_i1.p1 TRINITY_DN9175_c0_g1~~TRINITY_DN9175_c0_g1_i1.p1  ORF type:complete len:611 (+),score=92.25 TRINITY_DN9175_c0_g1_i1:259-1833(+)
MARVLLDSPDIDVNKQDLCGCTALVILSKNPALSRDSSESANEVFEFLERLLSKSGIDLSTRDKAGNSALHYAVLLRNLRLVRGLIRLEADINLQNAQGETPYHFAVSINDYSQILAFRDANPRLLKNKEGKTQMDLACDEQARLLIQGKETSFSHPFQVFWITSEHFPALGNRVIGCSGCPGRCGEQITRQLDEDIHVLKELGVGLVVSVITYAELVDFQVPHLPNVVKDNGMKHISYTIQNKWLPRNDDNFVAAVDHIAQYVSIQKVVIHCSTGRGRSSLIIAAVLLRLGIPYDEIVTKLPEIKPDSFRNPAQRVFFATTVRKRIQEILDHEQIAYYGLPKEQTHKPVRLSKRKKRKEIYADGLSFEKRATISPERRTSRSTPSSPQKAISSSANLKRRSSTKPPRPKSLRHTTEDDSQSLRQRKSREAEPYDANRYLDDIFDEFAENHKRTDLSPRLGEEIVDLSFGDEPLEYSGIELGEDPNYEAWWEYSFTEDVHDNTSSSDTSQEEDNIVFVPRELKL